MQRYLTRTLLFFSLILTLISSRSAECFDKVIIWGHKLHTHTHSYIHERFYRAFQHLGYPTFWFDDNDDVSSFDFSNSLFLTEGQVDKKIPLRNDCLYMLHNCDGAKYREHIQESQWITFQVYTDDVLKRPNLTKVAPCIYYDIPGRLVYMPWASDLLPFEIDEMKKKLPNITKIRAIHWIGTLVSGEFGNVDQVGPFKQACLENNIVFIHNDPWIKGLNRNECTKRISTSYLAPAIVGKWQLDNGYIPCRIFNNISCGQMGMTNSFRTYELFDYKILYNSDTYKLFYDAKNRLVTWTLEDQYELMDIVKEKHTYLNRIETLLNLFKLLGSLES
jgi:hypothetical protein